MHHPVHPQPVPWSPKVVDCPDNFLLVRDDLDLLRLRRLDPRAAALLDPPSHQDAPSRERTHRETGRRKLTLVTFQNRNGEVLAPAPPEIHVDRAAALAHRHDLALDQRETT